jgi:hypothetical protein
MVIYKDNIKVIFKLMVVLCMGWIQLAQDRA